jgi:hypothetical protein
MTDGTRIGDVDMRVVELTGRPGNAFVMHCDTPPPPTVTMGPG